MKRVLLIEDSSFSSDILTRCLQELKCEVISATSIAEAKDCWEENKDFSCIILDLHIAPLGLDEKSINEYNPVFGWKWLEDTLSTIDLQEQKAFKQKTIIHSKYLPELTGRYKTQLNGYTLIEKAIKNHTTSIQKVIERVKQII